MNSTFNTNKIAPNNSAIPFSDNLDNTKISTPVDDDYDWDTDELNTSYLYSADRYLFSLDLETALQSGSLERADKYKYPRYKPKGIYVVAFRVIKNKGSNVLVYNSVYYDELFTSFMLKFLLCNYESHERRSYNSYKNNFFVLDPNVLGSNTDNDLLLKVKDYFKHTYYKTIHDIHINIYQLGIYNTYDYFRYLSKVKDTMLLGDNNKMSRLIEQALQKNLKGFLNEITDNYFKTVENRLKHDTANNNFNMINRCIFVIRDLDSLLTFLRNNRLDVIAGPKNLRDCINSLTSCLSLFDSDFRYALYTHNLYHSSQSSFSQDPSLGASYIGVKKLGISKFSFKNIHMNLGNARYYSIKIIRDK